MRASVCYPTGAGFDCCGYKTPISLEDRDIQRAPNYAKSYEKIVRDITARDLSYDSDILRSVYAIFVLLSEETGMQLLCGMPVGAMLEHFASFGRLFPSWSWAGWNGGINWFGGLSTGLHSDGSWTCGFTECKSTSDWTIVVKDSIGSDTEFKPDACDPIEMRAIESCALRFTARPSHVRLKVLTVAAKGDYLGQTFTSAISSQRPYPGLAPQVVVEDKLNGVIYVDSAYWNAVNDSLRHSAIYASCIELSSTDQNSIYYGNFDEGIEYSGTLPRDACDVVISPACCNILLIEWETGVAYRRGAGQIHADAWDRSNSSEQSILLG